MGEGKILLEVNIILLVVDILILLILYLLLLWEELQIGHVTVTLLLEVDIRIERMAMVLLFLEVHLIA